VSISISHLHKSFGTLPVLRDLSLEIPTGALTALLGPSGSGKTTLLRIMAGLDRADSGTVLLNGRDVRGGTARDRRVGFVFQHYALFKHMTVFDNVAFGLRMRPHGERPSGAEITRRVMELLEMVHLGSFRDRYPHGLSGGQKQRVALVRALAVEPSVLFLDEPFGALDAKVRAELRLRLRRLHDSLGITAVLVTHDREEAAELADLLVVMHDGRIEQAGTPADLYHRPVNAFVHDFLGPSNLFRAVRTAEGGLLFGGADNAGMPVRIRPHALTRVPAPGDGNGAGPGLISGTVLHVNAAGPSVRITLEDAEGRAFVAETAAGGADRLPAGGEKLFFRPDPQGLFIDGEGI
jgi:sulfate transport system ATP-binding protein